MAKELVVVPFDWFKNVELQRIRKETTLNMNLTGKERKKVLEETSRKQMKSLLQSELDKSIKNALSTLLSQNQSQTLNPASNTSVLTRTQRMTPQRTFSPGTSTLMSDDLSESKFTTGLSRFSGQSSTPKQLSPGYQVDARWELFMRQAIKDGHLRDPQGSKKTIKVDLGQLKDYIYNPKTSYKTLGQQRWAAAWYKKLGTPSETPLQPVSYKFQKLLDLPDYSRPETRNLKWVKI